MTEDQLHQIMPNIGSKAATFIEPLNRAMAEFDISTPARQAAFIAQLAHESGEFRYMQELADGSAYENRQDLGNLEQAALDAAHAHGSTTGRFYKGHGAIQITGYYNHRDCGAALGFDLVNMPNALTEPELGCRSAAWFWSTHGLNELADEGKFESITRRINGGINGLADRMAYWDRAVRVLATDFGDVKAGVN